MNRPAFSHAQLAIERFNFAAEVAGARHAAKSANEPNAEVRSS
jgi:hypothetical protein